MKCHQYADLSKVNYSLTWTSSSLASACSTYASGKVGTSSWSRVGPTPPSASSMVGHLMYAQLVSQRFACASDQTARLHNKYSTILLPRAEAGHYNNYVDSLGRSAIQSAAIQPPPTVKQTNKHV